MQPILLRKLTIVGLVLLLLMALGQTAWMMHKAARVQADMSSGGRWLRGATIVVDPGHGGNDPGAVVGQTLEKDLVLQVSLLLKQILEAHGAQVVLIRAQDENLGGTLREELGRRVDVVRQHEPAVFVSIHANKDRCHCWGAQTFYQRDGMPAAKTLALAIQHRLRQMTPTTRTALPADYFVLRNSPEPATIVEIGFLSHAPEHQRLKDPDYQRVIATAIALGIADFIRTQVPMAEAGGSIAK